MAKNERKIKFKGKGSGWEQGVEKASVKGRLTGKAAELLNPPKTYGFRSGMAKFWAMQIAPSDQWNRSPSLQALHEDLNWIKRAVSNRKLCEIFEKKAIARATSGEDEVAHAVRMRRKEINDLGSFTLKECDGANEHHKRVALILTEGCKTLNEVSIFSLGQAIVITDLLKNGQLTVNDKVEIPLAIISDAEDLSKELQSTPEPMSLGPSTIRVYFMDDPDREPEIILAEGYSKYFQIGWYMSHHHNIPEVDVWVRHKGQHTLTTNGLFWEHVRLTQAIQKDDGAILDVDIVDVRRRDRYIVALVQDENKKEKPVSVKVVVLVVIQVARCSGSI
ncbi:1061_t:CDS:2, partial [Acaulospora colombiana]